MEKTNAADYKDESGFSESVMVAILVLGLLMFVFMGLLNRILPCLCIDKKKKKDYREDVDMENEAPIIKQSTKGYNAKDDNSSQDGGSSEKVETANERRTMSIKNNNFDNTRRSSSSSSSSSKSQALDQSPPTENKTYTTSILIEVNGSPKEDTIHENASIDEEEISTSIASTAVTAAKSADPDRQDSARKSSSKSSDESIEKVTGETRELDESTDISRTAEDDIEWKSVDEMEDEKSDLVKKDYKISVSIEETGSGGSISSLSSISSIDSAEVVPVQPDNESAAA